LPRLCAKLKIRCFALNSINVVVAAKVLSDSYRFIDAYAVGASLTSKLDFLAISFSAVLFAC